MDDWKRFEPSQAELADGMITKNARQCRICYGPDDRYINRLQCRNDSGHFADLNTGIFEDHNLSASSGEPSLELLVRCSSSFMEQLQHLGGTTASGSLKWRMELPINYTRLE